MRPTFRYAAILAVIIASLAPGLAQARPLSVTPRALSVEVGRNGGFFGAVWSLLTDVLTGRVPGTGLAASMAKDIVVPGENGGRMDPNGATTMTTPAPPDGGGDNGGHLDPNG